MLSHRHETSEFETPRWQAVRLGLRLANDHLGLMALGLFYGLWVLIGLALCFVLIPLAVSGKTGAFENALTPVALYGFLLPMALIGGAVWAVKLFSRFLWCAVPEPLLAMLFAFVSVAGRLFVVVGAIYLWIWGGPYGEALLRPEVVGCSAVAWFGLLADWAFIRTLRREFLVRSESAGPLEESARLAARPIEESLKEPKSKSVFTRNIDLEAWLKSRFPRGHKFVVMVLLPVAYVSVSSMANNGDPRAIPTAILGLAVIAPVFIQVFWIPNQEMLTQLWVAPVPKKSPANLY